MKDAGIRIRVEKELRDGFTAACQLDGRQASDVLREFMQTFVAQHPEGQTSLFTSAAPPRVGRVGVPPSRVLRGVRPKQATSARARR